MAYFRGDCYLFESDLGFHIWVRGGNDGWRDSGWARSEHVERDSGVLVPAETIDRFVLMRLAEMLVARNATAKLDAMAAESFGIPGNANETCLRQNLQTIRGALEKVQEECTDAPVGLPAERSAARDAAPGALRDPMSTVASASQLHFSRLVWLAWWAGFILIILSWADVVSHTIGWIGFGLAAAATAASVIANRYWKPPPGVDVARIDAELKRSLRALAAEGDVALSTLPDGCVKADELALEYSRSREAFTSHRGDRLSEEQRAALQCVDRLLDAMSGAENAELWMDDAVRTHPRWAEVRARAGAALRTLGW